MMAHVQSLPSIAIAGCKDAMTMVPVNVQACARGMSFIESRSNSFTPDLICHGREDVE
jgi:hypothetical protein